VNINDTVVTIESRVDISRNNLDIFGDRSIPLPVGIDGEGGVGESLWKDIRSYPQDEESRC